MRLRWQDSLAENADLPDCNADEAHETVTLPRASRPSEPTVREVRSRQKERAMSRLDRLSALFDQFALEVTPAPPETATLLMWRCEPPAAGWRLLASPAAPIGAVEGPPPDVSARFSWGGRDNPLIAALPARIDRVVAEGDDLDMIARLLASEQVGARCGAASVINRLGEVLIVRLLRDEIANGAARPGLLGALADPRLARAIVAIHEAPGRAWRTEDLAQIAGLSRSRFAELFQSALGEGPSAYLRRWRLTLARRELERGARVQSVARRYGYGSGEALNRALQRAYATSPRALRREGGDAGLSAS